MLNLRNIVKNLPLLAQAISGGRSQLLKIIQIVWRHQDLFQLRSHSRNRWFQTTAWKILKIWYLTVWTSQQPPRRSSPSILLFYVIKQKHTGRSSSCKFTYICCQGVALRNVWWTFHADSELRQISTDYLTLLVKLTKRMSKIYLAWIRSYLSSTSFRWPLCVKKQGLYSH